MDGPQDNLSSLPVVASTSRGNKYKGTSGFSDSLTSVINLHDVVYMRKIRVAGIRRKCERHL